MDNDSAWTCHARPARFGGVPCRTVNTMDALACGVCGCTRKASWDREGHGRDDALAVVRKRLQRHTC
mgnify:FL=1